HVQDIDIFTYVLLVFFFQAEDGIRYRNVTGVQTCALPISSLGASHRLASLVLIEDDLSDPYGAGGDLHAFVLSSKLQRFLQRKLQGRGELFERVLRCCAHVREFLLPGNVDVHVIATRVLTDDLPFVHLRGGVDEEGTAVLQVQQRVWSCRPGAVGDEGT